MQRRTYLRAVAGVAATTAVAGCLQGDAVLAKTRISATSPTKEWEVELEEGTQMRLEVDQRDDGPGAVYGSVHHAGTGEEIARTSSSGNGNERFEVPETGTYVVSIEVDGNTGDVRLRDMDS